MWNILPNQSLARYRAPRRSPAQPLMNAGDMSMLTDVICSAGQ